MCGFALVVVLTVATDRAIFSAPLPPGAVLRLGETRFRARGEVRHLSFSADGMVLLGWARERDGQLHPVAWETNTGVPSYPVGSRFPPDVPATTTAAARLTGDRVVTAGPGCSGRVWDATTGRQLALLSGHSAPVTAVAVSLDARRIATGSADGLVKVWETDFFHPLLELGGHTGGVRLIRVSADGTRAVTAGDDRTVRVWDLKSGKELRGFRTMAPIDLTPDGTAVVMRMGERTVIRDVLTGLEIIPDSPPVRPCSTLTELLSQLGLCVAISPEGHTIAVANRDGTIGLYEAASGQLRRTLPGHGALCHGLCFTPDGTRLLTAGADQQVLVWAVRMQDLPLPTALQRETRAGKLWTVLASGPADAAYLAMARFAAEPAAAVKMARLRLQPAETAAIPPEAHLAEQRGIELLEALGTVEAREFLEELATGDPLAPSTRAARQALEWLGKSKRLVVGLGRNASLDPPSLFWMR